MSPQELNVYNLPAEVDERELAGRAVIVIDLLRATTTICAALAAGASEVVPFRTIDETLAAAEKVGRKNVVLGGERGGRRIDGFDLGNSPSEYTPQAVGGRPVFITTTNGTQAMYHARLARRVVLGSFLNLSALAASIREEQGIAVLCAGTDGEETEEDILFAGAIVERLCTSGDARCIMNNPAKSARELWQALVAATKASGTSLVERIAAKVRDAKGGRNLIDVGLEHDLIDCAQIDRLKIVPELDVRAWRITVAAQ